MQNKIPSVGILIDAAAGNVMIRVSDFVALAFRVIEKANGAYELRLIVLGNFGAKVNSANEAKF